MKILQEGNDWVLKNYGKFFEGANCSSQRRLHRYMLTIPSEDGGLLLYNGITKELVEFEDGDDLFDENFDRTMWFVPEDFDEASLVMDIKRRLADGRPKTWKPMNYTILTTTDCNARCFYCYEKNIAKKNMSDETASDVGDYIVRHYEDPEKKRSIKLSWFGGEPLFNRRAIDIIVGKIREAGIPYTSSMISNGYLFNEEMVRSARMDWHLRSVQITLDGTSENYRKAKNFVNSDPNPFETVLGNIEMLSRRGIRVSIRINVGYYNCEDISNLLDILGERFKRNPNVSVYAHTLFDNGGVTDITDAEREEKVFSEMSKIEAKASAVGLKKGKCVDNAVRGTHCMADNGRHAVIQCNGDITLCEHYADSQKYTSIYSDEEDDGIFDKFREVAPPYERCFNCPLFLECSSLVMCEDTDKDCSVFRQRYRIGKKIEDIKRSAKMIKKRQEKEKENGGNDEVSGDVKVQ